MPDATPIPDLEVDGWPGAVRMTIGAPPGLEEVCRPIEAIVDQGQMGKRYSTRWTFTDEEITRLAAGDPVYVSFFAPRLVPHGLSFLEPVGTPVEADPLEVVFQIEDRYCPSCGSLREEAARRHPDAKPDDHFPECARVGTCGQFGPPWYPQEEWHPFAEWTGGQETLLVDLVRHRAAHHRPAEEGPLDHG